jgi:hypothetical protein
MRMKEGNEEIKYQSKLAGVDEAEVIGATHHLRNQRVEPQRAIVTQLETHRTLHWRTVTDGRYDRVSTPILRSRWFRLLGRVRGVDGGVEFQTVLLSLLEHESAEAEPDEALLSQVARGALLRPQEQVESVLEGVFCPARHELGDLRPLLRTL